MKNLREKANVIGALMAGALIGGALAIVFAPAKGSDLRLKLMKEAQGLADELKSIRLDTNALRGKSEELKDIVEKKMESIMAMVKQKAELMMHHN